jgi:hypothetical protein
MILAVAGSAFVFYCPDRTLILIQITLSVSIRNPKESQ